MLAALGVYIIYYGMLICTCFFSSWWKSKLRNVLPPKRSWSARDQNPCWQVDPRQGSLQVSKWDEFSNPSSKGPWISKFYVICLRLVVFLISIFPSYTPKHLEDQLTIHSSISFFTIWVCWYRKKITSHAWKLECIHRFWSLRWCLLSSSISILSELVSLNSFNHSIPWGQNTSELLGLQELVLALQVQPLQRVQPVPRSLAQLLKACMHPVPQRLGLGQLHPLLQNAPAVPLLWGSTKSTWTTEMQPTKTQIPTARNAAASLEGGAAAAVGCAALVPELKVWPDPAKRLYVFPCRPQPAKWQCGWTSVSEILVTHCFIPEYTWLKHTSSIGSFPLGKNQKSFELTKQKQRKIWMPQSSKVFQHCNC